jgi:hypothetical protein
LTEPEQYAAAKLRLLRGFDEIDNMLEAGRRLPLEDASEVGELLGSIGVE